jgi:hypothetical protein
METETELIQKLEESRAERLAKFQQAVVDAGQEFGCDLVARPYIAPDGTIKCHIQAVLVA